MMKSKLQHTSKTGIKKKIEMMESKPNKRIVTENKPPLKSELVAQLKALQKEHDTLEHEHENNLCNFRNLEEKVSKLPKLSLDTRSVGTQTFSTEIRICCNICIYVATCEEELNWHMGESHDQPDDSYFDKDFYCDICSKWFDQESDMIDHRKQHHVVNTDSDRLNCNFCEEKFSTKKHLMKHKKTMHMEKVSICWRFVSGTCIFGDQNCWFIHSKSSNNLEAENLNAVCVKFFVGLYQTV